MPETHETHTFFRPPVFIPMQSDHVFEVEVRPDARHYRLKMFIGCVKLYFNRLPEPGELVITIEKSFKEYDDFSQEYDCGKMTKARKKETEIFRSVVLKLAKNRKINQDIDWNFSAAVRFGSHSKKNGFGSITVSKLPVINLQ